MTTRENNKLAQMAADLAHRAHADAHMDPTAAIEKLSQAVVLLANAIEVLTPRGEKA